MSPAIWRFDNVNSLYYALIDTFKSVSQHNPHPKIALPTGNTMIPFYKLATEHQAELKTQNWTCFQLDEYFPITNETQRFSFKHFLNTHFFSHAPVKETFFFDQFAQPEDYEKNIERNGGLDLVLLGIGVNGHIAFNEPGSEPTSRTRLISLHPQTLMANFRGQDTFTEAVTLGIETILSAKKIIIVANGKNKAAAVRAAINEAESRTCPASFLRRHSNVTWFLDPEAAELL